MKWPGNSGIWFRNLYQFDLLEYETDDPDGSVLLP